VEELDLEVVEDLTMDSTTRARGRQGAGARAGGQRLSGRREGSGARDSAGSPRRSAGARARTWRRLNSWSSGGGGVRHREAEVGGQEGGGGRRTARDGRRRPGQRRPLIFLCRDPIGEELEVHGAFCKNTCIHDVRHPFRAGGSTYYFYLDFPRTKLIV
jgi:hypothetical protein